MNKCIIYIIIVEAILFLVIIAIIHIHYRQIVKEKNKGIIRQIREQQHLLEELLRNRIEKETIEKLLRDKLESASQSS